MNSLPRRSGISGNWASSQKLLPALVSAILAMNVAQFASGQEIGYQGQLLESNVPFNGTAAVKFAIIKGGTIWSNDGTSVNGSAPLGSVNIVVTNGLFNAVLGSPPMIPITGSAASDMGGATLRIWVSTNGGGSFTQLSDQRLASTPSALGLRQVDPAITNTLARWDGLKLSGSSVRVDQDGKMSVGNTPVNPQAQLAVVASGGTFAAGNFRNDTRQVSVNGENQFAGLYAGVNSQVAPGVTDTGVRIGVNADALERLPSFAGTITDQRALSVTAGTLPGANGTVTNSYGVFLQQVARGGPVQQAFGIFQTSEITNTKNYFQNRVGVGTLNPSSPLTVAGVIESTSGGIRFPDGTIQTTAGVGGIQSVNGSTGPAVTIQGSGGITVSTTGNTITIGSTVSTATCIFGARTYSVGATCTLSTVCTNSNSCFRNPPVTGIQCTCTSSNGVGLECGAGFSRYSIQTCGPTGTWQPAVVSACLNSGPPSCGQ
ncbi:MAG TPA: hypothetical protein VK157_04870 [Phycisphaerales bacterium]|nr:hypothetical protein [Phycisphaerales bacterium]